jgi:hypothetical protein
LNGLDHPTVHNFTIHYPYVVRVAAIGTIFDFDVRMSALRDITAIEGYAIESTTWEAEEVGWMTGFSPG